MTVTNARPSRRLRPAGSPWPLCTFTLSDGTAHVIFEPEDFIARLAALVPKPRAHLTRYQSVFAPTSPPFGAHRLT